MLLFIYLKFISYTKYTNNQDFITGNAKKNSVKVKINIQRGYTLSIDCEDPSENFTTGLQSQIISSQIPLGELVEKLVGNPG